MARPASADGSRPACVFDAYGTLFDIAAPAEALKREIGTQAEALTMLWRRKQLEYSWLRSLMGHHADFWQVTTDALDHALEALAIRDLNLRDRLLDGYRSIALYPEVPAVLRTLRDRGVRLAILSNGTPSMVEEACTRNGIRDLFEALLSIEAAGIYKPHPSVYALATDQLDMPADQVHFVSSNGWDIAGAAAFGLRTLWVNRGRVAPDRLPFGPSATIADLTALPALLEPAATATDAKPGDQTS